MKADAYEAALRIILRRPHSEGELAEKLRRKEFDADEIIATLGQLRSEKHLDDARIAQEFVRYCLQYKPMGRRAMAQKMMLRRFTRADIDTALSQVTPEVEQSLAQRLVQTQMAKPSLKALPSQRRREKLARFLLARGFDSGIVAEQLEQATIT